MIPKTIKCRNCGADIEVGGWKNLSIAKTQFGDIEIAGKTIKITKLINNFNI